VTEPATLPPRSPQERQILTMLRWLLYAIFVVVGWAILTYIARVVAPVLAALGIAYLISPVHEAIVRRGVSRSLAALGLLVLTLGSVAAAAVFLVPRVAHEATVFAHNLPRLVANFSVWAETNLGVEVPADWRMFLSSNEARSMVDGAAGPAQALAQAAVGGVFGVLAALAELLLVPVFAFYFLVDLPVIRSRIRGLIPPRRRGKALDILAEIDGVIAGWVRGQVTVLLILAGLYALGFSIVGMPLAIPIGLVVGMLSVIPFIGAIVGGAIAVGITVADGGGSDALIGVAVVLVVLHLLEALILTPKIVGHKVGLSESGALFAVFAGGKLLGFVGVLLAVPIAATIAVLVRHAVRFYERTDFFGDEADARVRVTSAMAVILPSDVARDIATDPAPDDDKEPT